MKDESWKPILATALVIISIGGCGRLMMAKSQATDAALKISAEMAKDGYYYCGHLNWCKQEQEVLNNVKEESKKNS